MFKSFQVLMIAGAFHTSCTTLSRTPAHTATQKSTKSTKFLRARRARDWGSGPPVAFSQGWPLTAMDTYADDLAELFKVSHRYACKSG